MVVRAYTLVRTEELPPEEVVGRIKRLRLVEEVTPVYGKYNIVVKTKTGTIDELNSFIYNNLRKIPGLTATTTMITTKPRT